MFPRNTRSLALISLLLSATLAQGQVVFANGFESAGMPAASWSYQPTMASPDFSNFAGWYMNYRSGVATTGDLNWRFGATAEAYEGTHFALLQSADAEGGIGDVTIQSTGFELEEGVYSLTFQYASRIAGGNTQFDVSLVGLENYSLATDITTTSSFASGQAWTLYTVVFDTASLTDFVGGETYQLQFSVDRAVTVALSGGDGTLFLDNVQLANAVPEPSSYAAILGLLASTALFWRRRKTRA